MIVYKNYLFFSFLVFFAFFESLATEMDFEFERNSINDHCASSLKNFDDLFLNDEWEIIDLNKHTTNYYHRENHSKMSAKKLIRGDQINGVRYIFYESNHSPKLMVNVDKECKIRLSRLLIKNEKGAIDSIANLSKDLKSIIDHEYFNPPLPVVQPFKGTKVALVDTGVNYTLKFITSNLSRKNSKTLSGYDFEDDDLLPFDVDVSRSVFFPFHHGTAVSSILLREAPLSEIVIYRFPRSNMCKFEKLIDHIALNKIKIVNLSMGSKNERDWVCFKKAATKYNNILFFVSAGNDGINIDENEVYPASFNLDNILVVTSSDIFGNLARGSNYGKKSVDFLVPGEQVPVIDHRGVKTKASGSSFSVPRIVAMAVRYLSNNPSANIRDISKVLISRAIKNNEYSRYGWIPDPLDDYLLD